MFTLQALVLELIIKKILELRMVVILLYIAQENDAMRGYLLAMIWLEFVKKAKFFQIHI